MKWNEPRPVDESVWLDCEVWDGPRIVRCGRVMWTRANPTVYDVCITYESENGLGLYCWPRFRVLSDAQDYVEKLMSMTSTEARKIHGTQWPDVVL